jgi:hypothetical protein
VRRREFIVITAGATAVAAARLGRATPCPAPSANIAGGQTVTTTCPAPPPPPPPPGSAPAWFTSLADLAWIAPASNWLGASGVVDPLANSTNQGMEGPSAIINDWTGMLCDQTRNTVALLANGGHAGYYGNEVYALDLRAAAPAWVRRRDASVNSGGTNIAAFSDGRPCSDHSGMTPVGANGRWLRCGMGGTNYVGYAHQSQWWEYCPFSGTNAAGASTISGQADDWVNLGNGFPDYNGGTATCTGMYDPVNNQIIVVHGGWKAVSATYYSLPNLTLTASNTNGLQCNNVMAAVDTTNKIILARSDTSGYFWLNYGTNRTGAWSSLSASGGDSGASAYWWHAPSQAFLTWSTTGPNILKLKPAVSSGAYTGLTISTVTVTGGVAVPAKSGSMSGGMYGKVQLVNNMGNGQSAMVIVSQYGNPDTYVLKIPVAGV